MSRVIYAADLFCGAGGSSTGLLQAAAERGMGVVLIAINHWETAIETHAANHPEANHLCASLDQLDPSKVVPRGKLDLLLASPECTHHSTARGGKPMSDQSRASAWHVLHWAERLRVENIVIENVREFMGWGPLGANGRPIERRKGETFGAWLAALRSLGYSVEFRVLNAADYGDATTRSRLFILATRKRGGVAWPEPSHGRKRASDLFAGDVQPWRSAREVIDWSIEGSSIFERSKPLAERTLARIAEGLRRFGGAEFLLGQQSGAVARPVSAPMPTVATSGAISLCEPFLVQYNGTSESRPVSAPIGTLTTRDRFGLVEPRNYDVRFRMLQPHELAAAMSFPVGYKFAGNRGEVVKQIGNAVAVRTAKALCGAALGAA